MCTVTYIPTSDGVFITSNRDEKSWREPAIPPHVYNFDTGAIMFPKDAHAGGSWIAAHENGNAIVFLNGAFESHIPSPPYKKSRGVVLLDLINSESPINSFQWVNLNNIEPFTAIIFDQGFLHQCRWDGLDKHRELLDASVPYIWSSATLYDRPVREKRESWFREWRAQSSDSTLNEILHFHRFTGDGDHHNDLFMNRDGQVGTVSITAMRLTAQRTSMHYLDLQTNQRYTQDLAFRGRLVNSQ